MTNEELAVRIKAGERDRLLELWGQVRDLIAWYAVRRYNAAPGLGGVEVDDLIQAGFIAMVEAVESFDPGAGYKFTTWLNLPLRTAFAEAGGYRSDKQKLDPLHRCDSLDRPINEDGDATLGEMQPAPDCYEDVERRIWLEQLRVTLDRAMEALPADWREILERRYYRGQSQQTAAEEMQVKKTDVQGRERKALYRLHHDRRRNHLDQFRVERALDLETPWFSPCGPGGFRLDGHVGGGEAGHEAGAGPDAPGKSFGRIEKLGAGRWSRSRMLANLAPPMRTGGGACAHEGGVAEHPRGLFVNLCRIS